MKIFLSSLGWLIAKTPECIVNFLCVAIGAIIYYFPLGRISLAHANIARALPEIPLKERRKIAFESARRMVEMALFVLASPHMSAENLKSRIEVSENLINELKKMSDNGESVVLMIPHFAMMETITMFPILVDIKVPRTGVFYRPFDIQGIESWVKASRQRFGIDLLSRKKGLFQALSYLREKGCVAVLFDQKVHSGMQSLLLDKVCMTSELPGILVENTKSGAGACWATRTGFWRSRIDCKRLEGSTIDDITYEGNKWLSEKLREDPIARYDWLWLHRRWQYIDGLKYLFGLRDRKNILEYSLNKMGLTELPRKFKVHITAPDSLRDTIALLPLVRLLRKSRPDAFVSLIVQEKHSGVVRRFAIADDIITIPNRDKGAFARLRAYRSLREDYPEVHLNFNDSLLDDICSKQLDADYSLAIQTSRKRLFMKDVFKPEGVQSAEHISLEYESFLRKYGLRGDVDYSPIDICKTQNCTAEKENLVAVICGGEGVHAWTTEKWCELIKRLSNSLDNVKFLVFGDESDSRTAFEIAKKAEFAEIENLATKYAIEDSLERLANCRMAIATDCATAHIANAVGVKTVAIYGATNPIRSGFVYNAEHIEILPQDCPIQGGGDVRKVSLEDVEKSVLSFYNNNQ